MRKSLFLAFAALGFVLFTSMDASVPEPTKAIVKLAPAEGWSVSGTVTFTKEDSGVRVFGHIQGLAPGKHGFHIHDFGDLTDTAKGASLGGHFDPDGTMAEMASAYNLQAGNFGNIEADAAGNATVNFLSTKIGLSGASSILGRSLVVHEKADDMLTPPSGNSGARIAFGVIGIEAEMLLDAAIDAWCQSVWTKQ